MLSAKGVFPPSQELLSQFFIEIYHVHPNLPNMKLFAPTIALISLITGVYAVENGEVTKTYTNQTGRNVEKIYWEQTQEDHVLISYPKDFDPAKTYHINFWFPGTGGIPGPGIEDRHDDYIGICLSYLDRDLIPRDGYATSHWALCKKVEASLVKRTGVKIQQRILSGVSKGGWMAFFTALAPPKDLHGVAIIAAGQVRGDEPLVKKNASHLAVFIGTGETDSNYPHAQMAFPFFHKSKIHSLCYEEWLRKGHVSIISPKLTEWLDVQSKRGGPPEELSEFCQEIAQEKLNALKLLDHPKDQYIALRHLMRAPSMKYAPKEISEKVKTLGKEIVKDEDLRNWINELETFRALVKKETLQFKERGNKAVDNESLLKAYQDLTLKTNYTDIAHRSVYAYLRALKNHTITVLRKQHLKETPHQQLQDDYNAFHQQLQQSNNATQEQVNQLYRMGSKINKIGSEASMKAFYDVEWKNKFVIDPEMQKKLDEARTSIRPWEIYSGIGY